MSVASIVFVALTVSAPLWLIANELADIAKIIKNLCDDDEDEEGKT